jgi:putative hydrolase of the HAD superfamily
LYDAILFDVGGTLLHVARDPQLRAIERVRHLGEIDAAAFARGVRQAVEEWRLNGGAPQEEDRPTTWEAHYRRALTLVAFQGDIGAAAQIMEATFLLDEWEVFDDVPLALQNIQSHGVRLGVISNWPATLEQTLARAALGVHFEVVIGSAAVGYAKPHPEIFRLAAARLGVNPSCVLYVGDSMEHDVNGARAAGMEVVLLDRTGRHPDYAPRLSSLSELPAFLGVRP